MPLSSRSYGASIDTRARLPRQGFHERAAAVELLTSPDLAHMVDLVAWREGSVIHARSHRGHVTFPVAGGLRVVMSGDDILERQDPLALSPLAVELQNLQPALPHYPFAQERLASAFSDEDRMPDLVVVHTDAHFWPERGGHLGEHGNLGLLQSRAPMLLSGPGVLEQGLVPAAARTVDVGATLAWLTGASTADLGLLDGRPLTNLVMRSATNVVGILLDGANCSALNEMALSGELPTLRRLLDQGCVLQGGAIAEFPSVTLVNHTSALTGVGPGRHGIVNNAFYDRRRGEQVLANDSATWHGACDILRDGVKTVWEMSAATYTACVNEPIDRGATYSTMGLIRASGEASGAKVLGHTLPDPAGDPHATAEHLANEDYAWSTRIDALGLQQMLSLWSAEQLPQLTWWNVTLTDSAHHNGGAHSRMAHDGLRDADRRLGVWLDLVESRGLLGETLVLVTADHGMTIADESCRGDWNDTLREAGLEYRDESYGFLYFE